MENRRPVKAKAKEGGEIAWPLDYGGADHFIARMGYRIRADVSIHKRFFSDLFSQLACPTHYCEVLRFELKSSRTATASISAVWGNMSKGCTATIRYWFCNRARSRARVPGLQET
jgi:hypothetical protein